MTGRNDPADENVARNIDDPPAGESSPAVHESSTQGEAAPSGLRGWRQRSAGFLTSAAVHGVVILMLALWVLPGVMRGERLDMTLAMAPAAAVETFTIAPSDLPTSAAAPDSSSTAPSAFQAALASHPNGSLPPAAEINPLRIEQSPPTLPRMLQLGSAAELTQKIRPWKRSDPQNGGVVAAQSVSGAVDGLLGQIRQQLSEEMLQVVWLMDASLSLHADRQELAGRLLPFYKEMALRPDAKEKPLRSAVVAYGGRASIIQPSTTVFTQSVNAVARMPLDPSGLENVFTAVQFTLKSFGVWKGAKMIVIWTDESGDDLPLLEETIQLCRQNGTVVHVVGPQAVLGMEQGLQRYVLPQTQQAFLLPVKRGPDAALPERLRLPYWFDSTSPPWTQGGAYVASGPIAYGGPLREGVLSGVGPYALTRLALETGGIYSILQRQGDSPALEWETQRLYLPDYGEAREILSEVQRSPVRQAVVAAAALTWQADLRPPTRAFFGKAMDEYPYAVQTPYIPPAVFQLTMKTELPGHIAQAQRDQLIVENALQLLDPVRLETAFESERSPRWRAWYDLNLGRLLAMSVRLAEYQETLKLVLAGVGVTKETNHLTMIESGQYKSGRVAEQRAVMARKHLQSVISDHRGTPWAQLAEWELQHELGFVVRPLEIPQPPPAPPAPARPAGGGGGPSLPSL